MISIEYFKDSLAYIIDKYESLDLEISKYLDRDLKSLDPIILSILRIGVYELLVQVHLPYRVVLNEALILSKKFGSEDCHKYVNGILDKVAKNTRKNEVEGSVAQ